MVILNHALLFGLLAGAEESEEEPSEGYLFPNDFLVLDEAHEVEDVAAKALGLEVRLGFAEVLVTTADSSQDKEGSVNPDWGWKRGEVDIWGCWGFWRRLLRRFWKVRG